MNGLTKRKSRLYEKGMLALLTEHTIDKAVSPCGESDSVLQ